MSPSASRATLLAALMLLPLLAAPAAGQGPGRTTPSGSGTLTFDVQRDRLTYNVAISENATDLDGSFDLDRAELNLSYTSGLPDDPEPRSVDLSLRIAGVYEFRDTNDDQQFDLGDRVVRVDPLETSRRASIEEVEVEGPVRAAEATYPLEDGGRVHVTIHATPELAFLDRSRPIQPTETELDYTLENVEPTREGTQLALLVRLQSEDLEHSSPRTVAVDGHRAQVLYRWPATATVDEQSVPAHSTVFEQRLDRPQAVDRATIVAATQPGDKIQGQASVTVVHTEPSPAETIASVIGDPLSFGLGLAASVILLAGTAWAKLKGRDDRTFREA